MTDPDDGDGPEHGPGHATELLQRKQQGGGERCDGRPVIFGSSPTNPVGTPGSAVPSPAANPARVAPRARPRHLTVPPRPKTEAGVAPNVLEGTRRGGPCGLCRPYPSELGGGLFPEGSSSDFLPLHPRGPTPPFGKLPLQLEKGLRPCPSAPAGATTGREVSSWHTAPMRRPSPRAPPGRAGPS